MSESFIQQQLREDERLLAVVRRSPLVHSVSWTIAVVSIIAGFFFMFPLLHKGNWGLLTFLAILIFGVVLMVRTSMINRMNVLILTSSRIIDVDQQGMFKRVISECQYDGIQDISIHITGFFGTIFRIGSLHLHTTGGRADLAVQGIKRPERVQTMIQKIRSATQKESQKLSAQDLVKMIETIKATDDQRLRELRDGAIKQKDGEN